MRPVSTPSYVSKGKGGDTGKVLVGLFKNIDPMQRQAVLVTNHELLRPPASACGGQEQGVFIASRYCNWSNEPI